MDTSSKLRRSRSVEVAAQCGVVDDKVLQALQHIDEALEAEERKCLSSEPVQLKDLLQKQPLSAEELDAVYRSTLSAVLNAPGDLPRPQNEYCEFLQKVCQVTAGRHERMKEAALAERQGEILQLKVTKAEGLMARDSCGTSDPYCQVAVVPEALTESLTKDLSHWLEEEQVVGQEDIFSSTIIEKTLDPEWNESFEIAVDDAENKFLAIELWDSDEGEEKGGLLKGVIGLFREKSDDIDDFLGKIYIPLKGITDKGTLEWYDLSSHRGNPRGRIQLSMAILPRLEKVEETTAMSVYTASFKSILSAEEDANGVYTPTWNGRVSPIAQEILQLLARRLGLKVLQQGACQLAVLYHGEVHFPLALLEAVKLVHSAQNDLGFRAAEPDVKPWVTDLMKRLQDISAQVQKHIEDHQTRIDLTCKEGLLLLEGHMRLLQVIYDIYPFIITMVIGKGAGHADKVLATAVQVSGRNWYRRLHMTSQEVDQEIPDHSVLAMIGTLRGMLNFLIWSEEELNPLLKDLEVDYFAETYVTFDLCAASELEETAERQELTELHHVMLHQTVKDYIDLAKQLPPEAQQRLKLTHFQTKFGEK